MADFIEIDVTSGPNCRDSLNRIYQALGPPRKVSRVPFDSRDSSDRLCQVTGWSAAGPCDALVAPVEDSGAGASLLLYGGDQGLRFKPADSDEPWDLASPEQWGEPCLLLAPDIQLSE